MAKTSSSPCAAVAGAGAAGGAAGDASVSSPSRKAASSVTVGWSKTRGAGSRSPVAPLSRLRSSTAVSESKPRSRKARPACRWAGSVWPRTAAAQVPTRSRRAASRSSADRPARRVRSPSVPVGAPASAVRRAGPRYRERSRCGTSPPQARSCPVSRRTGTRWGRCSARAASKSAMPSAAVSGRTPERRTRARSVSSRWPVRELASAHRPQDSEVVGSPSARRRWARASR